MFTVKQNSLDVMPKVLVEWDYCLVWFRSCKVTERANIGKTLHLKADNSNPEEDHLKNERGLHGAISVWQLYQALVLHYYFYLLSKEGKRYMYSPINQCISIKAQSEFKEKCSQMISLLY